jgi:type IV pilus assembly protein PilV
MRPATSSCPHTLKDIVEGHEGQQGFSLIEGMLATVVLGVGILAVAGMQGISLGRNADANELTAATNLAAEMVERIQFNRRSATVYNNIDTLVAGTQPTTDPMAGGDYIQWRDRLNNSGLANVQGRITVTPIGPTTPPLNQSQVTVQVTWRSSVKGETSAFVTRNLTLNTIIAPE